MEPTQGKTLTDDEIGAEIRGGASAEVLTQDRAGRTYDRIRSTIERYLEERGSAVGSIGEYLLLVPDIFILLWRLSNDARVSGKDKMLLLSSIAYYVFPFDFLPEGLMGPVGYLDDLIFAVMVLKKILAETDEAIVREHWSGKADILDSIRNVLHAAENLVGSNVLSKVKKVTGHEEPPAATAT